MKRVLITGANGMLGSALCFYLKDRFDIYATSGSKNSLNFVDHYKQFDLKNDSFDELINWANPEIIIHCAALTNGNYCDNNPLEAMDVNGVSLRKMAKSIKVDSKLIYISTDAVFNSQAHLADEKTYTDPESVYGKSKELGEFFLRQSQIDFTIVRTTIVGVNFNATKQGFVEWIINSAKENKEITLFDDVLFTPISCVELANHLDNIISSPIKDQNVLHVSGGEIFTKYKFGIELLKAFDLKTEKVKRGKISDFADRAKRSQDQSINSSYFQELYKRKLPDLKSTILNLKEMYHDKEKYYAGSETNR